MDLLSQTLVLYVVIGIGVSVAMYAIGRNQGIAGWFLIVTALVFWPLYLPILLTHNRASSLPAVAEPAVEDTLAETIQQVDGELDAALKSLTGWAEGALSRDHDRIADIRHSWLMQAQRIRDMDRILSVNDSAIGSNEDDARILSSKKGRSHNIDRLRQIRKRATEDLARSLASVRELVSLIHLARFSGAPAARAEELVAELAAAVTGASEQSWLEETNRQAASPAKAD